MRARTLGDVEAHPMTLLLGLLGTAVKLLDATIPDFRRGTRAEPAPEYCVSTWWFSREISTGGWNVVGSSPRSDFTRGKLVYDCLGAFENIPLLRAASLCSASLSFSRISCSFVARRCASRSSLSLSSYTSTPVLQLPSFVVSNSPSHRRRHPGGGLC